MNSPDYEEVIIGAEHKSQCGTSIGMNCCSCPHRLIILANLSTVDWDQTLLVPLLFGWINDKQPIGATYVSRWYCSFACYSDRNSSF